MLVACGEATLVNGNELDYLLASRDRAPFISVAVAWEIGWRPHAGLVVKVVHDVPRISLQQLNTYQPIPKLDEAARHKKVALTNRRLKTRDGCRRPSIVDRVASTSASKPQIPSMSDHFAVRRRSKGRS